MSTESELEAIPMGPPWSIDVIADLHAGIYSDVVSAQLRRQMAEDTSASAVLKALDATVDELSLLPSPRMPERFALRLDAAIAVESAARTAANRPAQPQPGFRPPPGPPRVEQPVPPQFRPLTSVPSFAPTPVPAAPEPAALLDGNVVSLDAARTRRRRWATGIGVAAAVAIAATITVASLNGGSKPSSLAGGSIAQPTGTSTAGPGTGPNAVELVPGQFQDAYNKIKGASSGPLTNAITAAGCFAANDIPGPDILGVSQVTFEGAQASAIAVKIDATHARILVVSLLCGVDGGADVLASQVVTR